VKLALLDRPLARAFPLSVLLLACGGSNDAPAADAGGSEAAAPADATAPSAPDAGAADDAASNDAATEDAASEDAPTSAPVDAAPVAIDAGAPLFPGASLVGWTTDERLIFERTGGIYALDRDAGVETVFAPNDGGAVSGAIGMTGVFVTQGSSLGIWTEADGYHLLTESAVNAASSVQSNDGTKVFYFQADADAGSGSDLMVANADGTGGEVLPVSHYNGQRYEVAFTASDGLVIPVLEPIPDSGFGSYGFDLFAGTSFAPLGQTLSLWSADPAVDTIFAVDSETASLVRASDGTVTPLDTGVTGGAIFDPAGANVYYLASSKLMRAPVAAPATKAPLVAAGAGQPLAVSPDGTQLEFVQGTNYFVVPTGGANGAVARNVGAYGSSLPYGPAGFFTTDSTYVISTVSGTNVTNTLFALSADGADAGATTTWNSIEFAVPMFDTRVLLYDESGTLFLADAAGKVPTKILGTNVQGFAESWDNEQVAWQSTTGEMYLAPAK
jgi:hypothetical protein